MTTLRHAAPAAAAPTALAQEVSSAILGPMLGLHPITAARWRSRAGTDRTAYLAARGTIP